MKVWTVLALLGFLMSPTLFGEEKDVLTIENNTGFILTALYLRSTEAEEWGENLLDIPALLNGDQALISHESEESPTIHIRARDKEGDTYTLWDVHSDEQSVILTLSDIDPD
ncbi:MAG: hypothetical protein MI717_15555 [Spirochaetales bacterium]|nr:hypothetical protein [Spirochaetales bacterium]